MILIAESGSTKTDWALIGDSEVKRIQTIGLNPYYLSDKEIARVFVQVLGSFVSSTIEKFYFYGAGCASKAMQKKVKKIAKMAFPTVKVKVQTDMLAACRGLLKNKAGVASILGTGSNACFYNGKQIESTIPSNGIWLGDEGSGGYFGKILVSSYLSKKLPKDLHERFDSSFEDRRDEIVEKVYRQKQPNAYLASFTPFLHQNKQNQFIQEILQDGFTEFFHNLSRNLPEISTHNICLTGSIAFHFSDTICKVAEGIGIEIESIEKSPIDGLINFHREKMEKV